MARNHLSCDSNTHYVDTGLVLVEGIQHYLEDMGESFNSRAPGLQDSALFSFILEPVTRKQDSSPHLSSPVEFIGEFNFVERYGRFHPVRTKVWRIRVDVHTAGCLRFGFSAGNPLPVHVFPPVVVR